MSAYVKETEVINISEIINETVQQNAFINKTTIFGSKLLCKCGRVYEKTGGILLAKYNLCFCDSLKEIA